MLKFAWNEQKNKLLQRTRHVSFEQIIKKLQAKEVVADLPHHNPQKYPNQRLLIINLNNYIYVAPYIKTKSIIFLKTIYPSRKLTKQYLGGKHEQKKL